MATPDMPDQNNKTASVPDLATLWQSRMTVMPGGFAKALTRKQFGQLKLLKRSLGDSTSQVMDWTLINWRRFSEQARAEAGLLCAPSVPHIGFLLAHHDTAVNLMRSIAAREKAEQELRIKYEAESGSRCIPKPTPTQEKTFTLVFTQAQRAFFVNRRTTKAHHDFLAAIKEKYGEDFIFGGGLNPENPILCDIDPADFMKTDCAQKN